MSDDVARDHRHRHRRRVPAARREPPEVGLGRFLVGQVEGLRVVFARELDHFLARDLVRAEIGLRADLQIFEIDHCRGIAVSAAWREWARGYASAVATHAPTFGRLPPAPDRGGGRAQREPARRRRADPQAAPQGRSVRRRARSGCWPSSPPGSGAGAMPRTCFAERSSWRLAGLRQRRTSRWCSAGWAGLPKRWSCSTTFSPTEPDEIGHRNLKAATLGRLGDFEQAIELYETF